MGDDVCRFVRFLYYKALFRPVRKLVNANPGLKVNQSINFSCIKMYFTSYVFFSLRLFEFKLKDKQCKQKASPKSSSTKLKSKFSLILA